MRQDGKEETPAESPPQLLELEFEPRIHLAQKGLPHIIARVQQPLEVFAVFYHSEIESRVRGNR